MAENFNIVESRPYPEEHSCRLENPDDFDKFRRQNCAQKHDNKCIDVIYGIKDNKSKIQALRYKTSIWKVDDAEEHCKSRKGTFEKAKESKQEVRMPIKLNPKGNTNARALINAGKVNKTSPWSFSAADGNKILGEDDWENYSKWHLGIDRDAEPKTKAFYKYPFGKNGNVYRSALIAIRQRAGQQKQDDIFEAAGRLIKLIDKEKKFDIEYYFIDELEHSVSPYPMTIQVRSDSVDNDGAELVGHAAVFDQIGDGGWFKEKIDPGAFKDSIRTDDIRALINHNPNFVLGRNLSGTLTLEEDKKGLAIRISPPNTQYARDLIVSVDRGDITQMSFGFITIEDKWEEKKGEIPTRTLVKVKLFDVSPVTFPFYEGTDIALRSHERWLKEEGVKHKTELRQRILDLKRKIGGF